MAFSFSFVFYRFLKLPLDGTEEIIMWKRTRYRWVKEWSKMLDSEYEEVLRISTNECIHLHFPFYVCTGEIHDFKNPCIFIAHLFVIAQNWKQSEW